MSNHDESYDVAVVGGGPAGVAAAATAARSGAKVVLIDRANRLGGSVTAALHRCLCGLYANEPKSPTDTLNDGVQREVVERLVLKAPVDVRTKAFGKAWVLEFPAAAYVAVLADLCRDAKVDVRLKTSFGAMWDCHFCLSLSPEFSAENAGRGGQECLSYNDTPMSAKVFVDCSGVGHIVNRVDAALPPDGETMLAGYGIRLSNIDGDPDLLRLQVPYFLKQAADAGLLHPLARFTVFHPGPGTNDGVCKLAIDSTGVSDIDLTDFATKVVNQLKANIDALRNVMVIEQSPHIMPRAGRRLAGEYVMTENDVLRPTAREGESVRAWWPIERWDAQTGPTYQFAEPGCDYAIPAAALQSDRIDNLLAAGMCLSATHAAAASSRASGICLATGDLAGRLAARRAGF